MHVVSWMFPESALADVVPCERCRLDWTQYLQKRLPDSRSPHLKSRASFTAFLVDGHNYVNEKLGKRIMSWEEARLLYDPNIAVVEKRGLALQSLLVICLLAVAAFWLFKPDSRCASVRQGGMSRRGCALRA
jgi:hypothetical protein